MHKGVCPKATDKSAQFLHVPQCMSCDSFAIF